MSNTVDRQLVAEARLLRRKRSYRGSLAGSVFLSLLFLAVGFVVSQDTTIDPRAYHVAFGMFVFWAVVAAYCKARLEHIGTLERICRDVAT